MRVNLLRDRDLRQCIRERRAERGLDGAELAKRAGISPSYVSLIESGHRTPNEETAARIAEALGDDPQLYRVLAARSRLGDAIRDPAILRSLAEEIETGATEGLRDEPTQGRSARSRPPQLDRAEILKVPFLPEGTDPARAGDLARLTGGSIQVEKRLLPATAGTRFFAYRIGPRLAPRVQGILSEGDEVVLSAEPPRNLRSDRLYAVRIGGRIILSRVLWKKPVLLLLPPDGGSNFDTLAAPRATDIARLIAGLVVLSIRAWK